MNTQQTAEQIIRHASTHLERRGFAQSKRFGTKPTEFWSEAADPPGITKVWIKTTDYPESVKGRYYFASPEDRDQALTSVQERAAGTPFEIARLDAGTSQDQDPRCRFYFDALIDCSKASERFASPQVDARGLGAALAGPPVA